MALNIVGQPYDWAIGTSTKTINVNFINSNNVSAHMSVPQTEIRIFCLEYQTNRPFLVRVPFNNYVIVYIFERNHTDITSWTETEIGAIKRVLVDQRGASDRPLSCTEVAKHNLYNYDMRKYLMFECRFRESKTMYEFRKLDREWHTVSIRQNGKTRPFRFMTTIHEQNIDPILKFLVQYSPPHQRFTFNHSSFIQVRGDNLTEERRISTLDREILLDQCRPTLDPITDKSHPDANFYVIDPKYCGTWCVLPKVMTFDLECQPERIGRFPTANLGDQIHMNAVVVERFMKPETRKVYYQIVGDCNTSTEFKNTEIWRHENEDELVDEFQNLIINEDPDIILTYNGDVFDNKYFNDRLTCRGKNWRPIGRLKNERPKLIDGSWESKQRGMIEIYELQMTGRPTFDVIQWIKAEYKLNSYSLGFVSRYFLTKPGQTQKKEISMDNMIKTYEKVKQVWKTELESIWTQTKRYRRPAVMSPAYKQTLVDLQPYVDYTIADSVSTYEVWSHLGGWTVLSEFAATLGLGVRHLYRKGQTAKVISQHYRIARYIGVAMIDRPAREGFKAKGGHVGNPIPGIYKFTYMIDFASMYPSIMQEKNMDYRTFVPPGNNSIPDHMCNIIIAEREIQVPNTKEIVTHKVTHKFVKREVLQGIVPQNVAKLVQTRNVVKKELKNATSDSERQILNARQLALKIAANSNFGYLLRKTGRYTFQEGGESITASGRKLILWCNQMLSEDLGHPIVYNDTDSSAAKILGLNDFKQGYQETLKATDYVNQKLREAHNGREILKVEMEKAMRLFLLGPKFYCYFIIDENGVVIEDPSLSNCRGVPLARRDKPQMMNEIYRLQMFNLMIFQPIDFVLDLIYFNIEAIFRRQIPYTMYTITRKLGAKYKSETFSLAVFADELIKRGKNPQPGDRLTYLIMTGSQNQGYRAFLIEEYETWLEEVNKYYNKTPDARELIDIEEERWLEIDFDHYLNLIEKQLDDMFEKAMALRIEGYIARRPLMVPLGINKYRRWVYCSNFHWMSYNMRPVDAFIGLDKIRRKCQAELIKRVHTSDRTSSIIKLDQKLNIIEKLTRDIRRISFKFKKYEQQLIRINTIFNDPQRKQNQIEVEAEITDINLIIEDMWTWIPTTENNLVLEAYNALCDAYRLLFVPVNAPVDWNIWNRRYADAYNEWNYIGVYLRNAVESKRKILDTQYQLSLL